MRPMTDLQLIVAVDERGGFAKDGKIPWNHKEDWEHFKATTKGAVCIAGRKTYDDILSRKKDHSKVKKILPNRDTYVITSSTDESKFVGVEGTSPSIQRVLNSLPNDNRNIFILGGEKLYWQGLSWAHQIYMTVVPGIYGCDRKFPVSYVQKNFLIAEGREENGIYFITYHRK